MTVATAAVVLPGSAFGAVTIGSNLDSPADTNSILGPVTNAQRSLVASHQAAGGLTSPINGVVVRWRIKGSEPTTPTQLRVIRPGGDSASATGGGTSPAIDPPDNTTTSSLLNPGLPIRAGDGIGIAPEGEGGSSYYHAEANVGELNFWFSLRDGAPPRTPGADSQGSGLFPNRELLLQAVIEPDKDGDKLGDESQDPDGGTPPAGPAPCTLLTLNVLKIRVGNLLCL
jgi:hypothetical protein